MNKQIIKENIKQKAVELFSEKGFYGTPIREIAKEAECSLPMLYYYYQNKEELFYEVAYNEFIELIERLNATVKRGESLQETYFEAIKQRKELSAYDKAIYKLSHKVLLGFEGDSRVRSDLLAWEKGRVSRTENILATTFKNEAQLPVFTNVFVRVIENLIERIILLDEDIPDEEIKKELNLLIQIINKSKGDIYL